METSGKHPEQDAENFWFVFFAYFLAIAAWRAVSRNVFITSRWRTVADTRKRGLRNLLVLSLGMPYLAVYFYFQAKSGDYKEASLALVAFIFPIFHLPRTVLGLWQLHVFKHWVIRSIGSMESLGYRVQLSSARNGKNVHRRRSSAAAQEQGRDRAYFEADNIIVNDTIVINNLPEVYVQSCLRFFAPKQKQCVSSDHRLLMRSLLKLFYAVESAMCFGGIVWQLLFSRSPLCSNTDSIPYSRPREPEELWLRWATVLISCAFPNWVVDMRKPRSEESAGQSSEYQVHRDRFAEEILCSATLHCERDTTKTAPGSLLLFHNWSKFPKLSSGTFCKQEFLKHACSTGNGLPFQVPHKHAASRTEKDLVHSYEKYRSKLEEARDALPAIAGEKLACLGTEELEWLSIFLSIEDWSVETVEEDNEHENLNSVQSPKPDSCSIAIANLYNQLGFPGNTKRSSERPPALLLKGKDRAALWGNRNVLTLSAHVDNWLALLTGEVASMVSQEPSMEEGFPLRNLKSKDFMKRTQESVGVTNSIAEERIRLEKQRLRFQLPATDPEFSHFEQSLTFLGCSMENLRTSMAKWVESNPEELSGAWTPTLGSSSGSTDAMNCGKCVFHASKDFDLCLSQVSSVSCWSHRFLQMRLLWELQNNLHSTLCERGLSPNQTEAILLCILSFPAIRVMASEIDHAPESAVSVQGNRNFCCIEIDKKSLIFRIEDCKLTLRAANGPQNVDIEVFFTRQVTGITITAQLCGNEFEGGNSFLWEAWRDAFYKSLLSIRQWQVEHQIANSSLSVRPCIDRIDAGICEIGTANSGIGPTMKVWKGWPPHRETLSKYEMMTEGLILERKKMAAIPGKSLIAYRKSTFSARPLVQYVPVSYDEAALQYLTRASQIAHELLRKVGGCSADPTFGEWSKEHGDLELLRYEISAAIAGGDISLGKAVNMLISKNPSHESIERAVVLLEGYFTSEATKAPSVRILESLSRPVRKENWVQKIKAHYEELMTATRFDPIAATSFASFCSAVPSHCKYVMEEDGIRALAISILRTTYSGNILVSFELTKSFQILIGTGNEESYFLACSMVFNSIERATKFLSRVRNCVALTNTQRLRRVSFEISYGEDNIPLPPDLKSKLEKRKADAQDRLEQLFLESGTYKVEDYASRAVELYSQAADDGDLVCAYELGFMFEYGFGVSVDFSRALELYTRASDGGIDSSLCPLAGLYIEGHGVTRNPVYAVELLTRAIEERGEILAMENLAHLLQIGAEGVPVDFPRAVRLLSQAAEEGGGVDSMLRLAFLLDTGFGGVPTDLPKAVRLYERAIKECGDHGAKINLAQLLANGADGVPVNLKRAGALFKSVIDEADHTGAMFQLAVLYQNGTGVPHDAVRATQLFQRAIDKDGDVDSMVHLADVLRKGTFGVPQDPIRAVELYTRAIEEHGSGEAMFKLASLLEFGENGVPSDSARAFSLYNRAASEKKQRGAARRLRKVKKQKQVLEEVKHIWSK